MRTSPPSGRPPRPSAASTMLWRGSPGSAHRRHQHRDQNCSEVRYQRLLLKFGSRRNHSIRMALSSRERRNLASYGSGRRRRRTPSPSAIRSRRRWRTSCRAPPNNWTGRRRARCTRKQRHRRRTGALVGVIADRTFASGGAASGGAAAAAAAAAASAASAGPPTDRFAISGRDTADSDSPGRARFERSGTTLVEIPSSSVLVRSPSDVGNENLWRSGGKWRLPWKSVLLLSTWTGGQ